MNKNFFFISFYFCELNIKSHPVVRHPSPRLKWEMHAFFLFQIRWVFRSQSRQSWWRQRWTDACVLNRQSPYGNFILHIKKNKKEFRFSNCCFIFLHNGFVYWNEKWFWFQPRIIVLFCVQFIFELSSKPTFEWHLQNMGGGGNFNDLINFNTISGNKIRGLRKLAISSIQIGLDETLSC